jgi:hypothetical protein
VGQILGPEGRNLLIGKAANLRRWAATHLGQGKPARKGGRPPTDLRPVATAILYSATTSAFHQRLVFERSMAAQVPLSARRDLRRPAYLRLDPLERFPRVTIEVVAGDRSRLFGPFRDRRAADRALKALHKLHPLRPCDYDFEPDAELPLGLGCVYAQVRTCAAPCLGRVSEVEYRSIAAAAATFLANPERRPAAASAWIPECVSGAGAHGLVIETGTNGLELYPVVAGAVCEEAAAATPDALRWPQAADRPDDTPWLAAWLYGRRRTGTYLVAGYEVDAAGLAARIGDAAHAAALRGVIT